MGDFLHSNGIVTGFLVVGAVILLAEFLSARLTKKRIHSSAIAIFFGLVLAYLGGVLEGGDKGLADVTAFSGLGVLGGAALRDFTLIASSFGADLDEVKNGGWLGLLSVFVGVITAFAVGALVACCFGYRDAVDVATIAAGAVTFVVGPVTGAALGAASEVVALSITVGLVKTIFIMLVTPLFANTIGLTTPRMAMVFGGLVGSTSGVSAGLAATDTALVPYGTMMATFYSGLGCLLCPSLLYAVVRIVL